jgi:hypothetical protein
MFEKTIAADTAFGAASILSSELWGTGHGISMLSVQELPPTN